MPDDNACCTGAWTEISTRVQARDRVLLSFVALTAAIAGIALSKVEWALAAISVGYAALATALLSMHHDLLIGLLVEYIHDLCAADRGPRWTSTQYYKRNLRYRLLRDLALLWSIVGGGIAALAISAQQLGEDPISIAVALWYGSVASTTLAAVLVVSTSVLRYKAMKRMVRSDPTRGASETEREA